MIDTSTFGTTFDTGGAGKIEYLADGNGDFAKALGLALDGTGFGLGTRSQRYSMVVEDGEVSMSDEDIDDLSAYFAAQKGDLHDLSEIDKR